MRRRRAEIAIVAATLVTGMATLKGRATYDETGMATRKGRATYDETATLKGRTTTGVYSPAVVRGFSLAGAYTSFVARGFSLAPTLLAAMRDGVSTRGRDTGDAQIFVNLVDNTRLDHSYTVFAEGTRGMDVVDAIVEGDTIGTIEIVR